MTDNILALGKTIFSITDQKIFADFSGDKNPIHIDPVKARKTLAGKCIVHGMHTFLWALEMLLSKDFKLCCSYKVYFKNAIFLDNEVICILNNENNEIRICDPEGIVFVIIKSDDLPFKISDSKGIKLKKLQIIEKPLKVNPGSIKEGDTYDSYYGGNQSLCPSLFPILFSKVGKNIIYEISILSNIIGMQLPGLNSLITKSTIKLKYDRLLNPSFSIKKYKRKSNLLNIKYIGNNINAEIEAFFRPESPYIISCKEINNKLNCENLYFNQKVLIIGGSRGIGSYLAKVIALMGGKVDITYSLGLDDANKVCDDINKNCKFTSEPYKFNIKKDKLDILSLKNYKYLFYLATPRIFGKQTNTFEERRYEEFKKFYCDLFKEIAFEFIQCGGKKIFYPSSSAVCENVKGLEEYKKAKLEGERLCLEISKNFSIDIIVERLDRINTDQTLTLLPVPALNPIDVAIKIAKRVS